MQKDYSSYESSTDSESEVAVRLGVRKEPCVVCGLPVFLAEKLVISRSLYHRTCFRCARCNNQLTLGNYYETEEGQYCCETCPDEEITAAASAAASAAAPTMHQDYNQAAIFGGRETDPEYLQTGYKRALSDEEKTSKRGSCLDDRRSFAPAELGPKEIENVKSSPLSGVAKIRMNFMTSHLLESGDDVVTATPTTTYYTTTEAHCQRESPHPADYNSECETPDESVDANAETTATSSSLRNSPINEVRDAEIASVNKDVIEDSFSSSFRDDQRLTAIATTTHRSLIINNTSKEEDTKDSTANRGRDKADDDPGENRLSLVQQRMKIFENNIQTDKEEERGGANSTLNTSPKNSKREIDKITAEIQPETDLLDSSPDLTKTAVDTSAKDSSDNINVEYEAAKPLELNEDKPVTAALILRKMMDDREPRGSSSLSNASGIDLSTNTEYPEDLNPFQSDDSDNAEENQVRMSTAGNKSLSTNPFGSSDDDEDTEEATPPRPAARKKPKENEPPTRRRLQAPQISLNPFWSDDEEHESDEDSVSKTENKNTPVPKPRKLKPTPEPSPLPRKTSLDRGGLYASNSSINSTGSFNTPGGTYRKKKPAPPPPPAEEIFSSSSTFDTLVIKSPDDLQSAKTSPRTPRARKMKPAPPPPMSTSTPQGLTDSFSSEIKEAEESHSAIWDDQKNSKDETNRNRQSLSSVSNVDDGSQMYNAPFIDKSAQGKWKRKKGPAPPRPLPHKRKIKVMSVKDVKLELDEIELQQQGLEKQGVRLEQLIRDKSETGLENEEFTSLRVDVEELVLELFALVNEKNELFRRQAELMLLRRQQRLEEEHADVEYQIRCLMSQPEATKTDSDKQREESLIQRLVEIVERRNEIVECLEMDRRREVEEDRSINEQMGIFAAKSKGDLIADTDGFRSSSVPKKEKAKDKLKEKKVKKSHKKDADKDVDETEMKLKRHKKKWF